ncbi:MAG: BrnT family toxin [Acetobacteraceae bacterium]|nr:BrnT family toxin [Acetobacteraceae bacterium]
MAFSWNEAKRLKALEERALDFADAALFFDGRPAVHQTSPRHEEDRWKTIAAIQERLFTIV